MNLYMMTVSELKFSNLIWNNEPISSGELVKLCEKELGWKKSTTYTVLKKLCEKSIVQNENFIVTSRISEEEYKQRKGEKFINDNYGGSLPQFLAAFITKKKLTKKQIEDIRTLIEDYEEEL